jgi:glycosyltransferase involved in cell wall biosynthesis
MRILISESTTAMGGQELAVLLHADGLRKRSHDVRMVLEPKSPIFERARRQGFSVDGVSMRRLRYPFAILAFRRLIVEHQADILHVNSSKDSWIGSIAAQLVRPRPKVVRSRHISTPLNRNLATRLLYRRLLDRIIVTGCELTRRGLVERDGLPPNRVVAFPIGIDVEEFRPAPPVHNLRRELGLPPEQKLVGLISYLRAYKGHDYFIEAAASVLSRVKDATFLIVGEGPEEGNIRSRIMQAGVTEGVRMLGFREDLLEVFRSLDLFVMPSIEADTIPQVLMQAMALGLPVISTTVGSIPDVVHSGETGWLVAPRQAGELAVAIVRLLADPMLSRTLGKAARELVERDYSLDRMVDRLESVYRSVIAA